MADSIHLAPNLSREERYLEILPQLQSLFSEEDDLIAKQANLCAVLKEAFDFLWIGFYRVQGNELVLGPFQGPLACTRIPFGKGVCGTAWKERSTIVVPNVNEFPGHIACSSNSRSEIVVPFFDRNQNVFCVLDIDSDQLDDFGAADVWGLEQLRELF